MFIFGRNKLRDISQLISFLAPISPVSYPIGERVLPPLVKNDEKLRKVDGLHIFLLK